MRFIITLSTANEADIENLGFRGADLANLREKRLNIPLTFIVSSKAFEIFIEENGLRPKIEHLLKEKTPGETYLEILELFKNAKLPGELEAELSDAYESLTIDPGADASSIVSKWDLPFVTLIRSPNYLLSTEDNDGILQNIRGHEVLVGALKHVWASIYSPKAAAYRSKTGMSKPFGLAVIVQKMKKIKQSAIVYSRSDEDERTIVVKSFFGLPDYGFEQEILGKDHYEVDLNSLSITHGEINVQEFSIERDFETEELVKHDLGDDSTKQKLNEKLISEVARLAKRSKSFIGKDVKLYMGIKDDYVSILMVNRLIGGPKKTLETEEQVEVKFDEKSGKTITQKQGSVLTQKEGVAEGFRMPKILSIEEVKAELLKQQEAECWAEEAEKLEPPRVEIYEEKTTQEEQVEKEINLLEEVLRIKEITEKMEEHALNNNKEAYEKEARVLKSMIQRIREEEEQQ